MLRSMFRRLLMVAISLGIGSSLSGEYVDATGLICVSILGALVIDALVVEVIGWIKRRGVEDQARIQNAIAMEITKQKGVSKGKNNRVYLVVKARRERL